MDLVKVRRVLKQVAYYAWGAGFLCVLYALVGYSFPALTDYFTGAEGSLQEKREVILYSAARILIWIAVLHVCCQLAAGMIDQQKKR